MSDTTNGLGYVTPSFTYTTQHKEWLPEPEPQLKLDVEPELLPCPFCGKLPCVERENDCLIIYCGCKVTVGVHGIAAEAISVWNTRYYPPEVVKTLKFYYKEELRRRNITTDADNRQAERALRAMGVLP